jgi:hypothetical protein
MTKKLGRRSRRLQADVLYHAEDAAEALREKIHPSEISFDDPRAAEYSRRYGEAMRRIHADKIEAWKKLRDATSDDQTPS